jgi:cell division cycle 20-like protein 1 (cofactor of APC complex)
MHSEYQARLTSPAKNSEVKTEDLRASPKKYCIADPTYSDRFIPSRRGRNLVENFALLNCHTEEQPTSTSTSTYTTSMHTLSTEEQKSQQTFGESDRARVAVYQRALVNELLGPSVMLPVSASCQPFTASRTSPKSPAKVTSHNTNVSTQPIASRLFTYKSSLTSPPPSALNISPLGQETQQLLSSPPRPSRKVPKLPFKVLAVPNIQDDFYMNLLDWSDNNVLAVGLNHEIYLFHVITEQVVKLCSLGVSSPTGHSDRVTSLHWLDGAGHNLAVGTQRGELLVWDVVQCQLIRTLGGHKGRIGAVAVWSPHPSLLSTGSRDRHILHRDLRTSSLFTTSLLAHRQEVCGLKWSSLVQQLASGGNDNMLLIWDSRRSVCTHHQGTEMGATTPCCDQATYASTPLLCYTHHIAAVKALAWSPHQRGLLLSGGGTADRTLKLWNTLRSTANDREPLLSVDTGSQVCNLAWCRNVNEIISTHGYSQNQIMLWSYFTLQTPFAVLTGHTQRVLYLALSPDNQTIATAAADETLRFWNISSGPGHSCKKRLFAQVSSNSEIR